MIDHIWTETVMSRGAEFIDGLSLHYYNLPDGWDHKGKATDFTESDWFKTMSKTLEMERFVAGHAAIMDKYDPKKRVGLMVDEWGNWFDVEPGTNPDFLFQQNSLRDALVAATNLNIFNNHSDRIRMACIAQMVNVLQALILTQGSEMVLTPTYYVYQQFAVHQGAALLPAVMQAATYTYEGKSLPALNASASKDASGHIHITICNIDPSRSFPLSLTLDGMTGFTISRASQITAAATNDYNTFRKKALVVPSAFTGFKASQNKLQVTMPAHSVVVLELVSAQ